MTCATSAERVLSDSSACLLGAALVRGACCRRVGPGLAQIGPDGRLQYEYMLKDNQAYTELVVIDPNESCAPTRSEAKKARSVAYKARSDTKSAVCSAHCWSVMQVGGARFRAGRKQDAPARGCLRMSCANVMLRQP